MVPNSSNRNELGRYLAMSQAGLEMIVPICLGLAADHYFGWQPWGVVVGAVAGLAIGLVVLVRFANKEDDKPPPNKQEAP